MIRLKQRSIRLRLFALVIFILLLGMLFNSIINIVSFKGSYEDALKSKMVVIANEINHDVQIGLKYFPLDKIGGLSNILRNAVQVNQEVSYAFISDKERIILYHSDKTLVTSQLSNPKYNEVKVSSFKDVKILELEDFYEVILPIFWMNNLMGYIHLGLEKALIQEKVRNMILQSSLIFGIALLASIILYLYMIPKIVFQPIDNLTDTIEKIVKTKDLTQKVPIIREDELGILAKSFNTMIENLNHTTISLDFFNSIIESIVDLIIVTNEEGKVIMVNESTLKLLGYWEEELIGSKITKIIPKDKKRELFQVDKFSRFLKEGYIKNLSISFVTKAGDFIPVSLTGSLITDDNGKNLGIALVARDLREIQKLIHDLKEFQKDLEEKNERLKRFNVLTVGREIEMIKLKEEINKFLVAHDQEPKYKIIKPESKLGSNQDNETD